MDQANNEGSNSFTITVKDSTAPVLTAVDNISAVATSSGGATVNYPKPTANDLVDGSLAVNCTPPAGGAFPLGQTTVTCTAVDAAGNSGSTSFQVSVTLQASALKAPVTEGSSYRVGQVIPIRFELGGASAGVGDVQPKLWLRLLNDSTATGEVTATAVGPSAGNVFTFNRATGEYSFNLATRSLHAGTWALRLDLGDGAEHITTIHLVN